MSTSKQRHPAAAALLTVLALTGCASDPGSPDRSDSSSTTAAESTEEPSAADGTDFSTCNTRCEVEVTPGVVFEYDEFTLTVTDVTDDGIELARDDGAGNTGGGSITAGCVSYMTATGSGVTCHGGEAPEPEPAPGQLAIELLHVTDGTAIIRLTMGS